MQAQNPAGASLEALEAWLREESEPHLSVLSTLLDAHELFGETGLASEALRPLFEMWYAANEGSLVDTLADLVQSGWLEAGTDSRYAVPEGLRQTLTTELAGYTDSCSLQLPDGTVRFGELVEDFFRFCQSEWPGRLEVDQATRAWGGRAFTSQGWRHLLLLRPAPLWLDVHAEGYTLIFCKLPEAIEPLTEQLVSRPALNRRLTLCDLEKAQKMNLTRSDLFVYFERYLRRAHGLRLLPAPAFTQGLVDRGWLSLDKG